MNKLNYQEKENWRNILNVDHYLILSFIINQKWK